MKFKLNIPALFLAALVGVSTMGIPVFEHICNTAKTRDFSFFTSSSCEMEKEVSPCCEKMGFRKKDDCCEEKAFFSKLSIEGYTAKQLVIKPLEKTFQDHFDINALSYFRNFQFDHASKGLPPPDNLFEIKALLQPDCCALQVFRC